MLKKSEVNALAIIAGNCIGVHIGRAFPSKVWFALVEKGYAAGGENADAPLRITEAGSAALLEAL